jgi:multicomponent Na+:H+ antiporter subunit G
VTPADMLAVAFSLAGGLFFVAGTVGVLRFPDTCTRLHAVTKADNLGLGLIVLGLLFRAGSLPAAGKLVVIWLLALMAGSTACFVLGRWAVHHEDEERS